MPLKPAGVALVGLLFLILTGCPSSGGGAEGVPELTAAAALKFSPPSGPVNTPVSIVGEGFSPVPEENLVTFHGTPAAVNLASPTSLIVYVPYGASSGPVQVESPSGTQSSAQSFLVVPIASKTIPDKGGVGTMVTVEGSGFSPEPSGNQVRFAGALATVVGVTPIAVTVVVPLDAETGEVTVTTEGGTSSGGPEFLLLKAPTVSGFAPAGGPVGTEVEIAGANFSPTSSNNEAFFNGVAAAISEASFDKIKAIVPDGALTGPVKVTSLGGTGQSAASFQVFPTVSGFSPVASIPGATVQVQGLAFDPDPAKDAVSFNGVPGAVTAASYSVLTAVVPLSATTGPVTVTTPGGIGTSAIEFVVLTAPPQIASFGPPSGPPGTPVTIVGSNFAPDPSLNQVTFNGVSASVSAASQTQIVAIVPTSATTGAIAVSTEAGADTSDGVFTVLVAGDPRFVLALNSGDGTISGFGVDSASGFLRHNGYSVTGTSAAASPSAIALHPSFNYVLVANEGSDNVALFRIENAGNLVKVDEEAAGDGPAAVAFLPNGAKAYVANANAGTVSAFAVDALAETLTSLGGPVAAGTNPRAIAVHPNGQHAYVANAGAGTISRYDVDAAGLLVPTGATPTGSGTAAASPKAMATDLAGTSLYVANTGENTLSSFAIQADGTLVPHLGSPFATGVGPVAVHVDPLARWTITANEASDSISVFLLAGGLPLLPSIPLPVNDGPSGLASDASGKFLYISHSLSNDIRLIAIGPGGTLIQRTVRARNGTKAVAVYSKGGAAAFQPKHLFCANKNSDNVNLFQVEAGGSLTLKDTKTAGNEPNSAAVTPNGKFLYVGNHAGSDQGSALGNSVSVFGIADSPPSLAPVQTIKTTPQFGAYSVAVEPSGRFLYVTNTASAKLSAYSIDQATGQIAFLQAVTTPTTPMGLTIDPTGRFAYVNGLQQVGAFRIDPYEGTLTQVGSPVTAGTLLSLCHAESTGKFFYVSEGLFGTQIVHVYSIHPSTGALTFVQNFNYPAGTAGGLPDAMASDPFGLRLYVCDKLFFGSDFIACSINAADGTLSLLPGNPFGSGTDPRSGVVDPSGKFFYTASQIGSVVSAYSLGASGVPTPIPGPFAAGSAPQGLAISQTVQ